jgi:hypothetical protein
LKVVAEQLGHVDTKMVERYYGHLASGHIAQTFKALPGVGLDKAAKIRTDIVIPMPIKRSTMIYHSHSQKPLRQRLVINKRK